MHQWELRDLWGLLNCSLSLVFAFSCTTNQAKALTFEGAFDFQTNLAKRNKIGFQELDKAKKKKLFRINLRRIKTKHLNLRQQETRALKLVKT